MKKIILAALALSCSTAFAGPAYVGVSAGSASQKMSVEGVTLSENSTAVGVNVGYQITPMFGIEAGVERFGEATAKSGDYAIGATPTSGYLAATVSFDVTPQFAVFGKAGAARSDTDLFASYKNTRDTTSKSGTSAMFGIGASYAFTPAISVVVEYVDFGAVAKEDGDKLKVSKVSGGVRFSF